MRLLTGHVTRHMRSDTKPRWWPRLKNR